jgi:hypothetical protein
MFMLIKHRPHKCRSKAMGANEEGTPSQQIVEHAHDCVVSCGKIAAAKGAIAVRGDCNALAHWSAGPVDECFHVLQLHIIGQIC